MRKIHYRKALKIENVVCNSCSKKIKLIQGRPNEGVFFGKQNWGYFSNKDGETHSFCLCEECYDKIVDGFAISVKVLQEKELI